jgi:hypothetical protein
MYNSYTLFQAEHVKTAREQREEDIRTGELAADFWRLWHSLAPSRDRGQRAFREAPEIEMLTEGRAACPGPSAAPGTICR